MLDLDEQLTRLRQRIASIDARYADAKRNRVLLPLAPEEQPARCFIEQWSEGQVVANEFGEHFQTERIFPGRRQHGTADIGALSELPATFLDALGDSEISATPPARWAFLD